LGSTIVKDQENRKKSNEKLLNNVSGGVARDSKKSGIKGKSIDEVYNQATAEHVPPTPPQSKDQGGIPINQNSESELEHRTNNLKRKIA